jgi:hypothetical protein
MRFLVALIATGCASGVCVDTFEATDLPWCGDGVTKADCTTTAAGTWHSGDCAEAGFPEQCFEVEAEQYDYTVYAADADTCERLAGT